MATFNPFDFFYLRSPSKSVNRYLELNEILNIKSDEEREKQLQKLFSEPTFIEAIYNASPLVYNLLKKWNNGELRDGSKRRNLIRTLYKYYARMCTRSTPFGTFAGCSFGSLKDDKTKILFDDERIAKSVKLDTGLQFLIYEYCLSIESVSKDLRFMPNNTIYLVGNNYRYVEYRVTDSGINYLLSEITSSIYLEQTLKIAKHGVKIGSLVDELQKIDTSIDNENITSFVMQLLESKFLISEMFPPVVTEEDYILELLKLIRADKKSHQSERIGDIIEGIRYSTSFDNILQIEEIRNCFDKISINQPLIQTDLFFRTSHNNINRDVIQSIIDSAQKLYQLGRNNTPHDLEKFIERFYNKFEGREVSLSEALDSDIGVGYGIFVDDVYDYMPLLKGVQLPDQSGQNDVIEVSSATFGLVLKKFKEYSEKKLTTVQITDADIDAILEKFRPISENRESNANDFFILGSIISESQTEIDAGNFRFLCRNNLYSSNMGKIMSRFASSDIDLMHKLKDEYIDGSKGTEDFVSAEIIHHSHDRIANVLGRPHLSSYEIPYLSVSALDQKYQIPIRDLVVSIRNNKVVLRSKRLDKIVRPRLTSAHNYGLKGLPVYSFLSDLQYQDINPGFQWDWGIFSNENFLPRVEYKNMILKRAQWKLEKRNFGQEVNLGKRELLLQDLIVNLNVPRYVILSESDNELPFDLSLSFSKSYLLQQLEKTDVILKEFLSLTENSFLEYKNEKYASEIVIPVKRNAMQNNDKYIDNRQFLALSSESKRKYITGSEWLYVKIYGSNKTIDYLISEILTEIIDNNKVAAYFDKLFFVRFADPESHLRIRFYNSKEPSKLFQLIKDLNGLIEDLISKKLVAKISFDTYEQEVERYGRTTIEESESLFYSDSIAVAEFLNLIEGEIGEELRWRVALFSIELLLRDFEYTLDAKGSLIKDLKKTFFEEFNKESDDKNLLISLNNIYRDNSEIIADILNNKDWENDEFSVVYQCFLRRSQRNLPTVKLLKLKLNNNIEELNKLLKSYIHMSMNRLFRSQRRQHEMIIYHFLFKYYESLSCQIEDRI